METYLENSHWNADDLLRLGIASDVAGNREEALKQASKLAEFIAGQPAQAVRDTLHLVKLSYAADLANEEAWRIAQKISQADGTFVQHGHESFSQHRLTTPGLQVLTATSGAPPMKAMSTAAKPRQATSATGIIAVEVYTPAFQVKSGVLQEQGIPAKSKQGQDAVAVWDDQEDSISMALTAVSRLLKKHVDNPYLIGRIEVGTESNVDMAKSIKSYLMSLLPSDHYDVEGVDNTNACYGGTAALLNSLTWCRETGKYAIVVATDTADMDLEQSGWRGAAAVAMLVGPDPWIEIHPERVSCFKNTHDFLKPRHSKKLSPYIQTRASMDYYVHALDYTIDRMKEAHLVDVGTLDAFVFHGGLCGTFMKLVERHIMQKVKSKPRWKETFELARHAATHVGGMYTASMYVNLVSLLSSSKASSLRRIALFSYGSGSTATLLQATIHHDRGHKLDLMEQIENRSSVGYDVLLQVTDKESLRSVLERRAGTYYRDLTDVKVERTYVLEGGDSTPAVSPQIEKSLPKTALVSQRFGVALLLALTSAYWVAGVYTCNDGAKHTLQTGAQVLIASVTTHLLVHRWIAGFPIRGSSTTLVHYNLGIMSFIAYGTLYAVDQVEFLKYWGAIFFGYFMSDNIMIITMWDNIHPSFRFFYSLHHAFAFAITGTWAVLQGTWDDYLILGVMLWLTAEIWQYLLLLYRHFPSSKLSASTVSRLKLLCFVLERLHRIVAYGASFAMADFKFSNFAYFVLGTGLFLDVFDASFQWKNVRAGMGY
jgi:hydroxymethylglutaryl-CoA synthase